MPQINSILNGVKKNLGIDESYKAFDHDIIVAINSAFFSLRQLGVGPAEGFSIEDESVEWEAFLVSPEEVSAVRNYVYLKTRMGFDLPTTSFAIGAYESQIKELEWRLMVHSDPPVVVTVEEL